MDTIDSPGSELFSLYNHVNQLHIINLLYINIHVYIHTHIYFFLLVFFIWETLIQISLEMCFFKVKLSSHFTVLLLNSIIPEDVL